MKLLSVAVPCYNVENYLDTCLTSFADPRLNDGLEVLIVNDGSQDRTPQIAEKYVQAYPAIFKLINKENGGHGSAVNAGIANASGKYFRIVDGDDWVHTDNLVTLVQRLSSIETDLVVDEKRTVHMVTREETFFPLPPGLPFDTPCDFREYCGGEMCEYYYLHTVMARTDLIHRYGIHLLEHVFYVDFEYILKVTSRSRTITFLDLDIYRYLIGNTGQSVDSQNYVRRYAHHDRVTKEVLRFAGQEPFDAAVQDYVNNRAERIIHTHYNISLIYNKDRRQGKRQAKEFRRFLKEQYPYFYRRTAGRYRKAAFLHLLGIDYDRLQKLMKRV